MTPQASLPTHRIRSRFDAALSDPDSLDVDALENLLDELHRHIAIEEYDLFPAAAQTLTGEQWESIGQAEAVSAE